MVEFSIPSPTNVDAFELVLAVQYPYLLIGPATSGGPLRWVDTLTGEIEESKVKMAAAHYDRPWHTPFSVAAPQTPTPAPSSEPVLLNRAARRAASRKSAQ